MVDESGRRSHERSSASRGYVRGSIVSLACVRGEGGASRRGPTPWMTDRMHSSGDLGLHRQRHRHSSQSRRLREKRHRTGLPTVALTQRGRFLSECCLTRVPVNHFLLRQFQTLLTKLFVFILRSVRRCRLLPRTDRRDLWLHSCTVLRMVIAERWAAVLRWQCSAGRPVRGMTRNADIRRFTWSVDGRELWIPSSLIEPFSLYQSIAATPAWPCTDSSGGLGSDRAAPHVTAGPRLVDDEYLPVVEDGRRSLTVRAW
jgi:hypothetical protein